MARRPRVLGEQVWDVLGAPVYSVQEIGEPPWLPSETSPNSEGWKSRRLPRSGAFDTPCRLNPEESVNGLDDKELMRLAQ